jgi:hypothetical protein
MNIDTIYADLERNDKFIYALNEIQKFSFNHKFKKLSRFIQNELIGYSDDRLADPPRYRALTFELAVKTENGWVKTGKLSSAYYRRPIEEMVNCLKSQNPLVLDVTPARGDVYQQHYSLHQCQKVINGVKIELNKYFPKLSKKMKKDMKKKRINFENESSSDVNSKNRLLLILNKFHRVVMSLSKEKRRENRDTIEINDEYDVQDLLFALLQIDFKSIQKESYGPKFAGKNPKIDFYIKIKNIGIETKMVLVKYKDYVDRIRKAIIEDKEIYSNDEKMKHLYFFVYDPQHKILNRSDFIRDLEKNKPKQFKTLKIIIKPDLP